MGFFSKFMKKNVFFPISEKNSFEKKNFKFDNKIFFLQERINFIIIICFILEFQKIFLKIGGF